MFATNITGPSATDPRKTAATDWVEQLKGVALDLTTIEVNTIEADCMTGRKMPSWPLALIDVARKYADYLTGPKVRLDLDTFAESFAALSYQDVNHRGAPASRVLTGPWGFADHELNRSGNDPDGLLDQLKGILTPIGETEKAPVLQLTNGPETFLCLQWAARSILAELPPPGNETRAAPSETTRVILQRIQRNCEQLRGLSRTLLRLARTDRERTSLSRPPAEAKEERLGFTRLELEAIDIGGETVPKPPAELLNRLRKAWDIGTERIVLQTVIQLDGDAIYRASREMLDPRHQCVAQAHERITQIALSHWRGLFDLVTGLLMGGRGQVLGSDFKPEER
jgi:hypothetical protein